MKSTDIIQDKINNALILYIGKKTLFFSFIFIVYLPITACLF